jgi:aminopeptidase YwaD
MTSKRLWFLLSALIISLGVLAQDRDYARNLIDSLASPFMYGRGYVNKGDSLAAAYIASQFEKHGLKLLAMIIISLLR